MIKIQPYNSSLSNYNQTFTGNVNVNISKQINKTSKGIQQNYIGQVEGLNCSVILNSIKKIKQATPDAVKNHLNIMKQNNISIPENFKEPINFVYNSIKKIK